MSSISAARQRLLNATGPKGRTVNPWVFVGILAPIPIFLAILFFVKWYHQKTDITRLTSQFIQRQNSVLAFNAVNVATGFSDLLEKAGRDLWVFSLMAPTKDHFLSIYRAQLGDFTRFDAENSAILQEPLPFYNRLVFVDNAGRITLSLLDGEVDTTPRPLSECKLKDLCDGQLFSDVLKLKPGQQRYGRALRYYSPEGTDEQTKGASLMVAMRVPTGVYAVGIDFLHLKDHLTTPTFPYDSKRDLLQAYQKGNYIYILDADKNIITHPLPWHEAGIDRATGEWVKPMRTDDDAGRHPINIAAYEQGRLRDYFGRMLRISFPAKSVDIFQAPNLQGTNRVLSVAPILLSGGQFREAGGSGVFGHAVVGCNVDYFEEPKERVIPYY